MSVILPVFNDADELRVCLERLSAQTYPADSTEIIVVDNGSTVDIRSVVERFPPARYLSHPTVGSYSARNAGVRASRGDILAFTDADCRPDANWLADGVRSLLRLDQPSIVTGKIYLVWRNGGGPESVAGHWEQIFAFNHLNWNQAARREPTDGEVIELRHGVTANMFMFRDTFDYFGGFNEVYLSGGDTDFSNRARNLGYRVAYEPKAAVGHPAREEIRVVIGKQLRIYSNLYYREQPPPGKSAYLYFLRRLGQTYQRRRKALRRHRATLPRFMYRKLRLFLVLMIFSHVVELHRLTLRGRPRRA